MTSVIPWNVVTAVGTSGPTGPADISCSTWDFFFNAPAWKACQTAKEQAQIQAVANRAATYYGPGSTTAQVAQQAADQQAAQAAADQANIADVYGAGSLLASTPTAGSPAGMPTFVMVALLVGSLYLLKQMNS